jgi:flagellar biosynthesis protein FlhA
VSEAVSENQQMGLGRLAQTSMLPMALIAFILMMVVPIPAVLLDVFFTANILLSLSILMVSVNTFRPLEFSSFPTVLLFATILRLSLNVASTRVVLVNGHHGTDSAGKVIQAFGEFVIGGNYVVGLLVFGILIVINLVVITKGTGRVSEVTARFTLDAMPGKQMAIDADLNAGLLTPEQARKRRAEVGQEADFYGSMDGATKFVKGDAIAGLLILAINIFGGLIIGMAQHGLSFDVAAQTYITLTIGDGLVAQVPSLLLSIATAVIVTRSSGGQDLSDQLRQQVGMRRAWWPVSGMLALLGLVPGMPNTIFLLAAAGAAAVAYFSTDILSDGEEATTAAEAASGGGAISGPAGSAAGSDNKEEQLTIEDVSVSSALLLEVGYGLIPLIEDVDKSALVARITGIRKHVSRDLGFVFPAVRIRDNLTLTPSAYRITIGGAIVAEDAVYPGRLLAIEGGSGNVTLPGEQVKDPTFGFDAVWIDPMDKQRAIAAGYTVVESSTVVATHLHQILMQRAADLLGQDDVQTLLDHVSKSAPSLVSGLVPKIITLAQLTQVLKGLVVEQISISDMRRILEALAGAKSREPDDLLETARIALAPIIVQRASGPKEALSVITLDPGLEQLIVQSARQPGRDASLIEPGLARKLVESLQEQYRILSQSGKALVLVTAPILRRELSSIIRQAIPDALVLSYKEIPETKRINVIAVIGGTE